MTEQQVLQLSVETIKVTAMVAAPLLLSTLAVGLVVSIVQAVTQINEATLTFIPKMLVVGIVLLLVGPWMLDLLTHFTTQLFEGLPNFVRE